MDKITLPLLFLPIFLGMLLTLIASGNRLVWAKRKNNSFLVIFLVLPILVYGTFLVGLRPIGAGSDTPRYVYTYNNLDGPLTAIGTGVRYFGNTELLWWPLQSLLRPLLSAQSWLLVNFYLVFVFSFLLYRQVAAQRNFSSAIFALAFLTFFSVYAGNIIREALSIPIGAIGFNLFFKKKYTSALLLICIAIGLHWSALVFLSAPIFTSRLFNKNWPYIIIPIASLLLTTFASSTIGDVVSALGIPQLHSKFDLYFSGDYQSHVGNVWTHANFWICTLTSFAFLAVCKPSEYEDKSFHLYTLLFLSLILFGVTNADFSERYMPYILLVTPLQMASLIGKFRLPALLKNSAFLGYFVLMAMLVVTTQSSQYTLGYDLG